MMPLTRQEEAVRNLLLEERLSFESHHVFELPPSSPQRGMSVDFLVFLGPGIAIECTACNRNRGSALSELRRRTAFMDYRFGLLKTSMPKLVCGALVEAPNEDQRRLVRELNPILKNSSFLASSSQELGGFLRAVERRT